MPARDTRESAAHAPAVGQTTDRVIGHGHRRVWRAGAIHAGRGRAPHGEPGTRDRSRRTSRRVGPDPDRVGTRPALRRRARVAARADRRGSRDRDELPVVLRAAPIARSCGSSTSTARAYDAIGQPWSDFTFDDEALEAQRMLTEWDTRALREATRLFTTSREVAHRLERFNGLAATPLYHPPPLHDRLRPGAFGDYVFCPTAPRRQQASGADGAGRPRPDERHDASSIAGRGSLHDALVADAPRDRVDRTRRAARVRRRRAADRAVRGRARGRLRAASKRTTAT